MAEIIKINIEVTSERQRLLLIPEKIEVPQFSIVQWNINDFDRYLYKARGRFESLIFTLYFDGNSPFIWKRQFVQLYDPQFGPFYAKTIRLAEDVADEKGDFKYGISVFDTEKNEPIYDEDPYLIVY